MGTDKESRHEALQHELIAELKSLRESVRDVADGFILCREGEIETLLEYLLKMPTDRLKVIARPWLRETRSLKLKPAKGRIKDLKKIDTLLHDLLNNIIEADDVEEKQKAAKKKRSSGNRKNGASQELQ